MQKTINKDYSVYEIIDFFKEMAFQYGEAIKQKKIPEDKKLTEVINSSIYYAAYPMIPNFFDLYDTKNRNKINDNILKTEDLNYGMFLFRFNFLSKAYEFSFQSLPEIVATNLTSISTKSVWR